VAIFLSSAVLNLLRQSVVESFKTKSFTFLTNTNPVIEDLVSSDNSKLREKSFQKKWSDQSCGNKALRHGRKDPFGHKPPNRERQLDLHLICSKDALTPLS